MTDAMTDGLPFCVLPVTFDSLTTMITWWSPCGNVTHVGSGHCRCPSWQKWQLSTRIIQSKTRRWRFSRGRECPVHKYILYVWSHHIVSFRRRSFAVCGAALEWFWRGLAPRDASRLSAEVGLSARVSWIRTTDSRQFSRSSELNWTDLSHLQSEELLEALSTFEFGLSNWFRSI